MSKKAKPKNEEAERTALEPKEKIEVKRLFDKDRIALTNTRFEKWGTAVVNNLSTQVLSMEKTPPRTPEEVTKALRAAKAGEKQAEMYLDGWGFSRAQFESQVKFASQTSAPEMESLDATHKLIVKQIKNLSSVETRMRDLRMKYEGLAKGRW